MDVEELGAAAYLYAMQSTPAVLLLGRRCMEEAYTFVWKPEQDPYLMTPRGVVVVLEYDKNIPCWVYRWVVPNDRMHTPEKNATRSP